MDAGRLVQATPLRVWGTLTYRSVVDPDVVGYVNIQFWGAYEFGSGPTLTSNL